MTSEWAFYLFVIASEARQSSPTIATGLPRFARNDEGLIEDNLSAKEQADLVETSKRIIAAYGDRQ